MKIKINNKNNIVYAFIAYIFFGNYTVHSLQKNNSLFLKKIINFAHTNPLAQFINNISDKLIKKIPYESIKKKAPKIQKVLLWTTYGGIAILLLKLKKKMNVLYKQQQQDQIEKNQLLLQQRQRELKLKKEQEKQFLKNIKIKLTKYISDKIYNFITSENNLNNLGIKLKENNVHTMEYLKNINNFYYNKKNSNYLLEHYLTVCGTLCQFYTKYENDPNDKNNLINIFSYDHIQNHANNKDFPKIFSNYLFFQCIESFYLLKEKNVFNEDFSLIKKINRASGIEDYISNLLKYSIELFHN